MGVPRRDLCAFLDASPTPYHAVAEVAFRLEAGGFRRLEERDRWKLLTGDRRYVIRDGGSIAAFRVGSAELPSAGFRLVGAHTDSPTFKVRPRPDVRRHGYRLVGVEPYGSVLAHSWLDRDLTLAGRIAVCGPTGGPEPRLVRMPGAPLRIPSLAIHLNREVRDQGLKLNPQQHLVPVWGSEVDNGSEAGLVEAVAELVGVDRSDVLGHDLVLADTQPAALGGADQQWVFAPRLDNLVSCHAAVAALLDVDTADATQVVVFNDHEEVGSGSAEGARGSFLSDVLQRVVIATGESDPQAPPRAIARSWLVSADMAHAVHPNYADRHEPEHRPRLGGGPVLKVNANQSYATDATSGAWFAARCADAGVPLQHFVTRADLPCGSTIGPLTAARLGLPTVDVGNPMLSMHSCREQAALADLGLLVAALSSHFLAP
jgi:aspartyl aminopeptidase